MHVVVALERSFREKILLQRIDLQRIRLFPVNVYPADVAVLLREGHIQGKALSLLRQRMVGCKKRLILRRGNIAAVSQAVFPQAGKGQKLSRS